MTLPLVIPFTARCTWVRRYEQDKESADWTTGAYYTTYVTGHKRKLDTVLRRIYTATTRLIFSVMLSTPR